MSKYSKSMIEFLDKVKKYHWAVLFLVVLLSEIAIYITTSDKIMFVSYTIGIVIMSIAAKYIFFLVLGFQFINPFCPRIILKFFCWFFIIGLSLILISLIILSILIIANVIAISDNQVSVFSQWGAVTSALSGSLLFYRKILIMEINESIK